jgi:hypothetical protein
MEISKQSRGAKSIQAVQTWQINVSLQVKSDSPTGGTFGQDHKTLYTTTVSATTTNGLDDTGKVGADLLNLLLGISWSETNTQTDQTQVTYDNQTTTTLSTDVTADTTIQDSSGIKADFIILQDAIFQGLAIQDSDMNYNCPISSAQMLAQPVPPDLAGIPVVNTGSVRPRTSAYIHKTRYGWTLIEPRKPTPTALNAPPKRISQSNSPKTALPTPAPAKGVPINARQALERLRLYPPGQQLIERATKQLTSSATDGSSTPNSR